MICITAQLAPKVVKVSELLYYVVIYYYLTN
jgi:hypothetical protein